VGRTHPAHGNFDILVNRGSLVPITARLRSRAGALLPVRGPFVFTMPSFSRPRRLALLPPSGSRRGWRNMTAPMTSERQTDPWEPRGLLAHQTLAGPTTAS
jgi:hypothetical protein